MAKFFVTVPRNQADAFVSGLRDRTKFVLCNITDVIVYKCILVVQSDFSSLRKSGGSSIFGDFVKRYASDEQANSCFVMIRTYHKST